MAEITVIDFEKEFELWQDDSIRRGLKYDPPKLKDCPPGIRGLNLYDDKGDLQMRYVVIDKTGVVINAMYSFFKQVGWVHDD